MRDDRTACYDIDIPSPSLCSCFHSSSSLRRSASRAASACSSARSPPFGFFVGRDPAFDLPDGVLDCVGFGGSGGQMGSHPVPECPAQGLSPGQAMHWRPASSVPMRAAGLPVPGPPGRFRRACRGRAMTALPYRGTSGHRRDPSPGAHGVRDGPGPPPPAPRARRRSPAGGRHGCSPWRGGNAGGERPAGAPDRSGTGRPDVRRRPVPVSLLHDCREGIIVVGGWLYASFHEDLLLS